MNQCDLVRLKILLTYFADASPQDDPRTPYDFLKDEILEILKENNIVKCIMSDSEINDLEDK